MHICFILLLVIHVSLLFGLTVTLTIVADDTNLILNVMCSRAVQQSSSVIAVQAKAEKK
jgi:hypothetical protein